MKHLFFLTLLLAEVLMAQNENKNLAESPVFSWPAGKRCAVSLTFDDARLSQIDKGIPLLNRYGVKATFYISPHRVEERLEGWRQAVADGHEIGNHTNTHPCSGNFAFSRDNALEDYTIARITQEIDSANTYIFEMLHVKAASFAYPCGQTFVGRGEELQSYVPLVAEKFAAGRCWKSEDSNDPRFCDFAQLMGMESDGKSFDELKAIIDQAAAEGRWLILAGHEMNDGGAQTTLLSSLEALCRYANDPANGIWIDTVANVAAFVKNNRLETQR